ncbi:MAG: UDP-N-acetylmuramate--L-alanine ligase [Chloroflexota bacterium]|nr:UDP-N-acetylmuramate--L-alanine ligase [Chloroflexota bacterium]
MVGIGGIGLSAIARLLAARGHVVTGSDLRASSITRALNALGVETYVGHAAEQVGEAGLLVVSSAIPEDNVEIRAARERGIPVVKRRRLLPALMQGYRGIAVAGTHGKTTTASMISVILEQADLDPSFIVGGIIADLDTNARAGHGEHFVVEADEYDRTFHGLRPHIAVVTNVEMDHPDCYRDIGEMREAFRVFLNGVDGEGSIVACADSAALRMVLAGGGGRTADVLTYGSSPGADYVVREIEANACGGVDCAVWERGEKWQTLSLAVPGEHNALNATAALIVSHLCGVDRGEAADTLRGFMGVLRRFEVKGMRNDIVVVDDYAHHPTEVRATLAAARGRYPQRRIWAVFQPHTYSRTQTLLADFASCFDDADKVIVTDIYPARAHEEPIMRAEELVEAVDHGDVMHIDGNEGAVDYLLQVLRPGDLLLTLGAGDGYLIGERVLARLG